MLSNLFLAAAESAAPSKEQSLYQTLVMIGIAVVFFYFVLWRPEQKRRKKMELLRNSLKKGDRVTIMGILATVHEVKENTAILTMVDGAKMEVVKSAISEIIPPAEAPS